MASSAEIVDGIRPAAPAAGSAREVAIGAFVATLLLALFGSSGLQGWADAKGDGRIAAIVDNGVAAWSGLTSGVGLTRPHDALRRSIRRVEQTGWR
jgi:hypothetical protein